MNGQTVKWSHRGAATQRSGLCSLDAQDADKAMLPAAAPHRSEGEGEAARDAGRRLRAEGSLRFELHHVRTLWPRCDVCCTVLRGATRARLQLPQLLAGAHNRCAARLDATAAPPPLLLSPPSLSTDLA